VGVNAFTYTPSGSYVEKADVRCKLFALSLLSISTLKAGFFPLIMMIGLLFLIIRGEGKRSGRLLMELKYFFILLFFVLGARALTTPGDPLFVLFNLEVSIQGLKHGGLICTRFFTIMLMGIVFASTTKPSLVKSGVEWFLKPVPFIPEKQAAVMIMLFLRFMPLILEQAKIIKDAHKARCADLEKNPVKKAVRLAVPLLKKTFLSADQLAAAMASRSYSQQRTDPEFYPSGNEGLICVAVIFLSALLFLF